MPTSWKVSFAVLILCLLASIVIGSVRLATTPEYTFTPGDKGWRQLELPR